MLPKLKNRCAESREELLPTICRKEPPKSVMKTFKNDFPLKILLFKKNRKTKKQVKLDKKSINWKYRYSDALKKHMGASDIALYLQVEVSHTGTAAGFPYHKIGTKGNEVTSVDTVIF